MGDTFPKAEQPDSAEAFAGFVRRNFGKARMTPIGITVPRACSAGVWVERVGDGVHITVAGDAPGQRALFELNPEQARYVASLLIAAAGGA